MNKELECLIRNCTGVCCQELYTCPVTLLCDKICNITAEMDITGTPKTWSQQEISFIEAYLKEHK